MKPNLNPDDIFRALARLIRINKTALHNGFQAKSRLVILDHEASHLDSYRSDAPTTTWPTIQLTKIIAFTKKWAASCFDVSTAFLLGKIYGTKDCY